MFDWLRKLWAKRETELPEITDPMDQRLLKCMKNCTIGGRLTLPSGLTLPPPPPGYLWLVNEGEISCISQSEDSNKRYG